MSRAQSYLLFIVFLCLIQVSFHSRSKLTSKVSLNTVLLQQSEVAASVDAESQPVTKKSEERQQPVYADECTAKFHAIENFEIRSYRVLTLIIFGTIFLFTSLILCWINKDADHFCQKAFKNLFYRSLIFYICLSWLFFVFIEGSVSNDKINPALLISGIAVFGFTWITFNVAFVFVLSYQVKKWKALEEETKVSFEKLRINYLKAANGDKDYDLEEQAMLLDYKMLKTNFITPLFPTYKASILKEKFDFSKYLELSLQKNLSSLFQFSWTTWLILILNIFFWNLMASSLRPTGALITITMLAYPAFLLAIMTLKYYYTRSIYRSSVLKPNKKNLDHVNVPVGDLDQDKANRMNTFNTYIKNIFTKKNSEMLNCCSLHEHFHDRSSSLYEDLFIGGETGLKFFLHGFQALFVLFTVWQIIFFSKHIEFITEALSFNFLFLVIPLFFFYLIVFFILGYHTFTNYSIISSIEMKRNDKVLKKTLNHLYSTDSAKFQAVFSRLRLVYVRFIRKHRNDLDDDVFELSENLKRFIYVSLARFKKVEVEKLINETEFKIVSSSEMALNPKDDNNNHSLHIDELKQFLWSSGCRLSEDDKNTLIGIITEKENIERISLDQLYSAWAVLIHMQKLKPEDLFEAVMKFHFNDLYDFDKQVSSFKNVELNYTQLEEFFTHYNEFEQYYVDFILGEIREAGPILTVKECAILLTNPRRHHPY